MQGLSIMGSIERSASYIGSSSFLIFSKFFLPFTHWHYVRIRFRAGCCTQWSAFSLPYFNLSIDRSWSFHGNIHSRSLTVGIRHTYRMNSLRLLHLTRYIVNVYPSFYHTLTTLSLSRLPKHTSSTWQITVSLIVMQKRRSSCRFFWKVCKSESVLMDLNRAGFAGAFIDHIVETKGVSTLQLINCNIPLNPLLLLKPSSSTTSTTKRRQSAMVRNFIQSFKLMLYLYIFSQPTNNFTAHPPKALINSGEAFRRIKLLILSDCTI